MKRRDLFKTLAAIPAAIAVVKHAPAAAGIAAPEIATPLKFFNPDSLIVFDTQEGEHINIKEVLYRAKKTGILIYNSGDFNKTQLLK